MHRFTPKKRTAIDGVVWWCVYDLQENKFSTYTCFGRYRTKKRCQWDIDHAPEYYKKSWR